MENRIFCPECGIVDVDEDGLCEGCGAQAWGSALDELPDCAFEPSKCIKNQLKERLGEELRLNKEDINRMSSKDDTDIKYLQGKHLGLSIALDIIKNILKEGEK